MVKFRIYVNRVLMGTVTVEDPHVTDPKSEAYRQGIIQRSDVYRASAQPVENDNGRNTDD